MKAKDYKSELKPIWCPGCGDFGVLNAILKAFAELEIEIADTVVVSGIGCSSRLPGYLKTYGFNSVHGRAMPIASGIKLAKPNLNVLVVGGDGDGFSIGGGHLSHAARKNIDLTYIVMDNGIYGLTKGQASPTSPLELNTVTTPYGNIDEPINTVRLMLAYGAQYVARGFSGDIKLLTQLIVDAVKFKGFSYVEAMSPCVTFRGKDQFMIIKGRSKYLADEGHDPTDLNAAFELSSKNDAYYLGLIYKGKKTTRMEAEESIREKALKNGSPTMDELLNIFMP